MNRLARDITIVFGITLLLLLSFEIILRFYSPERRVDEATIEAGFEHNDNYIVDLKPNVEKVFTRTDLNGGARITWRTNSDGFRGEELRAGARPRVMIYGDSNLQARFTPSQENFPRRLEEELRPRFAGIEVINAGVVGFGPDQMLLKFKQEADMYSPDLVIFQFFADNDFGDPVRNRLFELNPEGRLVRTRHAVRPDERLVEKPRRGLKDSLRLVSWAAGIKSRMKLREAVSGGAGGFAGAIEKENAIYSLNLPREYSNFDDHYDFDVTFFPTRKMTRTKLELAREILKEARDFARSREINFMVVVQPSSRDLSENSYPNHTHFRQYDSYRPENLSDFAWNILEEEAIPGLNLFPVFKRNNPSTLFHLGINDHWNSRGQALGARAAGAFIKENGLLERPAKPGINP